MFASQAGSDASSFQRKQVLRSDSSYIRLGRLNRRKSLDTPGQIMSETAVTLTLSDEEKELLFEILEERHGALLREIWHTDHRDFKLSLQKKERVLDSRLSRFMVRA